MNKISTILITLLVTSFSYAQCESIFIRDAYQFNNTDEYYINLYLNEGFDYESSVNIIEENLDLLIFEDKHTEISRKRIKIDCATKYFNLKGLETIYFYNKYNELIGSGIFKRAELYDNFERDFIAVYKPSISDNSQKPYYASNCELHFTKTELVKTENKNLENKIISTYKIDKNSIYKTSHFKYSKDNSDYSIISYEFPNLNSILVKHKEGKLKKLYETLGKNYILRELFISAFEYNNKPIFIVGFGKPDSGYQEIIPLFYDGEEYDFKSGDRSGSENTKGDFNGDGVYEYVHMENPEFPIVVGPIEEGDDVQDCVGKCVCYLKFSNNNIPSIIIENCIGGKPVSLGDLNNDGTDEIGILPQWWSSCWMSYKVYTFKNGNWKYLVEPIKTHCNSWTENFKIIEKDPKIDGNVIIRYTEMSEDMDFITKTKSIKVD